MFGDINKHWLLVAEKMARVLGELEYFLPAIVVTLKSRRHSINPLSPCKDTCISVPES